MIVLKIADLILADIRTAQPLMLRLAQQAGLDFSKGNARRDGKDIFL
jgi:hypothetical protein